MSGDRQVMAPMNEYIATTGCETEYVLRSLANGTLRGYANLSKLNPTANVVPVSSNEDIAELLCLFSELFSLGE